MTRKDHIVLAAALRNTHPHVARRSTKEQRATYECWHDTRGYIMAALAEDNPNFNRQRFINESEPHS